ncbi:MAG: hypothetical protein SGJ20_22890, partial [Planctomycetota bacterium]|nr:hypothetical protein [Planctomycetota bacterium]
MRRLFLATAFGLLACGTVHGQFGLPQTGPQPFQEAISAAMDADPAVAARGIKQLRDAGPEGLQAFLNAESAVAPLMPTKPVAPRAEGAKPEPETVAEIEAKAKRARFTRAVDAVGAQCDNVSRLYWYTDLESAKAAARKEKQPILSMRMLGNLNEELSCANSRFFRTTLYPNHQVASLLRYQYILHWESVRPVPKVTIDFGDGRVIKTTLTGNSIHYVLDSEGRIIDALPGLYGPAAFVRGLETGRDMYISTRELPEWERAETLRLYHQTAATKLLTEWQQDLLR